MVQVRGAPVAEFSIGTSLSGGWAIAKFAYPGFLFYWYYWFVFNAYFLAECNVYLVWGLCHLVSLVIPVPVVGVGLSYRS